MNAVREFNEMSFDGQNSFDMAGLKDATFDTGPVMADSNEAGTVKSEQKNQGVTMDVGAMDVLALFSPAPIAFALQVADVAVNAADEAGYQQGMRQEAAMARQPKFQPAANDRPSFSGSSLRMTGKGFDFVMTQGPRPSDMEAPPAAPAIQHNYAPRLG